MSQHDTEHLERGTQANEEQVRIALKAPKQTYHALATSQSQKKKTSPIFYSKSMTVLVPVLRALHNGKPQHIISKELGIPKQQVSYYLKKLVELGFVKESVKDVIKIYELTQPGLNFLIQYEKSPKQLRAEKVHFKAKVLEMPKIPINWEYVQMRNWGKYITVVDDVRVLLNNGKEPTIEFVPGPLDGDDLFILHMQMIMSCHRVKIRLERDLEMKIGDLTIAEKGEWLVYNPLARAYAQKFGQITIEGIGKVNASKPRNIGEFEFYDPRALADFLAMPLRIANLENAVTKVAALLEELRGSVKDGTSREVTKSSIAIPQCN